MTLILPKSKWDHPIPSVDYFLDRLQANPSIGVQPISELNSGLTFQCVLSLDAVLQRAVTTAITNISMIINRNKLLVIIPNYEKSIVIKPSYIYYCIDLYTEQYTNLTIKYGAMGTISKKVPGSFNTTGLELHTVLTYEDGIPKTIYNRRIFITDFPTAISDFTVNMNLYNVIQDYKTGDILTSNYFDVLVLKDHSTSYLRTSSCQSVIELGLTLDMTAPYVLDEQDIVLLMAS